MQLKNAAEKETQEAVSQFNIPGISVSLNMPSKHANMLCTLPVSHVPKPRRSAAATDPHDEKSRSSDVHLLVSIFPKSNDSQ